MATFTWTLLDASGAEMRTTEPFPSQAEAEAWMGAHWSALLDEGAEYVSLREDDEQIYRMGLREG
jgi:uncharacterized protein (DUF736 family)